MKMSSGSKQTKQQQTKSPTKLVVPLYVELLAAKNTKLAALSLSACNAVIYSRMLAGKNRITAVFLHTLNYSCR